MSTTRRSRGPAVKAAVLLALLVVGFVLQRTVGTPDLAQVREAVDRAGWWGPALFAAGYSVTCLLPAPKSVLTIAAGVLFGLALGSVVAWSGALLGSLGAFALAKVLGRDAVDRLLRGRLARADALLGDHGFTTVLLARLVPLLPFTAVNYGAGVTGIRFGPYLAATAIGMVPGTVAYTAVGAVGETDPRVTWAAVAALVLLTVGGGLVARHLRGRAGASAGRPTAGEPAGGATSDV